MKMKGGSGEWDERAQVYCPYRKFPMPTRNEDLLRTCSSAVSYYTHRCWVIRCVSIPPLLQDKHQQLETNSCSRAKVINLQQHYLSLHCSDIHHVIQADAWYDTTAIATNTLKIFTQASGILGEKKNITYTHTSGKY